MKKTHLYYFSSQLQIHQTWKQFFSSPAIKHSIWNKIANEQCFDNSSQRARKIYIYIIRKWRTENGNRGFRILFPRVVLPPPPFETPMPTRAHGHVHLSAGYKRIASCARVCTHAEKAASDAYTRVCTRESIVRPTEEVRGWQATASRHFLLFFFLSFSLIPMP